jgi:hypothetical protein
MKVPFSPASLPAFVVVDALDDNHSNRGEVEAILLLGVLKVAQ